jgi:Ca-activated chloride channel family protein
MSRTFALVLAVCIAATVALFAQQGARERVLFTSVVDKNGEPVAGLGPDDFVVREDGVRREVLRVTRATEPILIALLVDNSRAADDDVRNIRDALTNFVQQMHKGNEIALIGLADRPTIFQDYTQNTELLKAAIGRFFAQPASGMTLLDALVEVSRGLERREGPRAVIIPVITDGPEFTNRYYKQVVDSLEAGGAALHAVTIGTFGASMNDALRNRASVLDEGPRVTGGQRISVLSSMGLETVLARLGRELSNQYKVVYGHPESLLQPEEVTVTVDKAGLTARGTLERRKSGA